MVALKTERRVYMWHVVPRAVPKEAPVTVTLEEILNIVNSAYAAGAAEIFLSDGGRLLPENAASTEKDPRNRVYIADIVEDNQAITLLINRGDPHVADTAFINAGTKAVRTVSPGNDESQGWSAHLVIAKTKKASQEAYRGCFERMPHANSWYTEQLIATVLQRYAEKDPKYEFKKVVKKGKKVYEETRRYRPALSVKKVPSDQIKEDIKNGELSSITLIESKPKFTGPDAPDIIASVKRKLVIKPKKVSESKLMKYIDELTDWAKDNDFNEIQIQITDLPGGGSASPRFLLEQGDATETLYVRSQRLEGFSTFLESCYASVSKDISGKMIALINNNKKW